MDNKSSMLEVSMNEICLIISMKYIDNLTGSQLCNFAAWKVVCKRKGFFLSFSKYSIWQCRKNVVLEARTFSLRISSWARSRACWFSTSLCWRRNSAVAEPVRLPSWDWAEAERAEDGEADTDRFGRGSIDDCRLCKTNKINKKIVVFFYNES